jgi:hypothetical protein
MRSLESICCRAGLLLRRVSRRRLKVIALRFHGHAFVSELFRPSPGFFCHRAPNVPILLPNYLSQRLIDPVLPARSGFLKVIKNESMADKKIRVLDLVQPLLAGGRMRSSLGMGSRPKGVQLRRSATLYGFREITDPGPQVAFLRAAEPAAAQQRRLPDRFSAGIKTQRGA